MREFSQLLPVWPTNMRCMAKTRIRHLHVSLSTCGQLTTEHTVATRPADEGEGAAGELQRLSFKVLTSPARLLQMVQIEVHRLLVSLPECGLAHLRVEPKCSDGRDT